MRELLAIADTGWFQPHIPLIQRNAAHLFTLIGKHYSRVSLFLESTFSNVQLATSYLLTWNWHEEQLSSSGVQQAYIPKAQFQLVSNNGALICWLRSHPANKFPFLFMFLISVILGRFQCFQEPHTGAEALTLWWLLWVWGKLCSDTNYMPLAMGSVVMNQKHRKMSCL